jgi:hypothetical protein
MISRNYKTLFLTLVLTGLLFSETSSQTTKTPKAKRNEVTKTNLEIGVGVMGSVLYLSRNIKEDNDAKGFSINGNYGGNKLCRIGFQYTYYKPINIEPTWYDVKAQTIEANLEILARFKNNKSFLYPFVGLSYNTFKGYFTGLDDFLGLREYYPANTVQAERWVGVNAGTGFEHAFGPVVVFADYRMRVGFQNQYGNKSGGLNIMDVCYGAGVRVKLYVPTLHKLYRGVTDRYGWF